MAAADASAETRRREAERYWLAEVVVLPKEGVNDPEGEAIRGGILDLGYGEVERVRAGRFFQVTIMAENAESARTTAERLCDQVLANPVIEAYEVTVGDRPPDEGHRGRP